MSRLDLASLIIPLVLETWLAVNLFRRKVHKEFPAFVVYTCYSLLAIATRLVFSGNYGRYFFVFWVTSAGFALLAIWVLHEVFHWVFAAFYEVWWFRFLFPAVALLTGHLSIRAAFRRASPQTYPLITLILALGIMVNYIELGLFGLFFVLIKFFRSRYWQYAFGILLGLAITAFGTVIAFRLRSEFGTRFDLLTTYLPSVAYFIGLAFWMDAFVWSPPPPNEDAEWQAVANPQELLQQVRSFIAILKKFWRK
jgi:hypothetical protein